MGQKSNPNSFQSQDPSLMIWSSKDKTDYSFLLRDNFEIIENIRSLFERNNCLVKDCVFLRSKETNGVIFFIGFLPIFFRRKKTRISKPSSGTIKLITHLFNIMSNFGYFLEKRIVFLNLDNLGSKAKKKFQNDENVKSLSIFKKEVFYNSGLTIFFLLFANKLGDISLLSR